MRVAPNAPARPLMRYHGGKWVLAKWLISYHPEHRVYVEPYGGAASVLLRKPRCYAEVYNDLDGEMVNLFRVLRNPAQARELIRLAYLTPYSREEFELSYIGAGDPVEQARRTLFRAAAGFGTSGASSARWTTGFRGSATRSGSTPAQDWAGVPAVLEQIVERLRGVTIENRPAGDMIKQYDGPETLFYLDPPYPLDTRAGRWAGNAYRYEMTDEQHRELSGLAHSVEGMVIISGYQCDLYAELYGGWERRERETRADHAMERTESIWLSPRTVEALQLPAQMEMEMVL